MTVCANELRFYIIPQNRKRNYNSASNTCQRGEGGGIANGMRLCHAGLEQRPTETNLKGGTLNKRKLNHTEVY